jgi:hypothetical protein
MARLATSKAAWLSTWDGAQVLHDLSFVPNGVHKGEVLLGDTITQLNGVASNKGAGPGEAIRKTGLE